MARDPWLPVGTPVGATRIGRVREEGGAWQVFDTQDGGRALVGTAALARLWVEAGLLEPAQLTKVELGSSTVQVLTSDSDFTLAGLAHCPSPRSYRDALSFALALKRTRELAGDCSLANGVFVEQLSLILPSAAEGDSLADAILLGRYLTGGVPVSVASGSRITAIMSWLPKEAIAKICEAAGLAMASDPKAAAAPGLQEAGAFTLVGRPDLERFFREHVIDVVQQPERYTRLGISFPGAIVLHGPPGTGKTFAVDRLAEHLGWPRFDISSGTIGSPFIHETSRKVAEVFTTALDNAPSILVIDEMEAFLTDRATDGLGSHRIEEVAEFLRRIPLASAGKVLVVGMTNRLDTIDPAILRRGRFDHIIEVGAATQQEIKALLDDLLASLPHSTDVDSAVVAAHLAARPLSDVSFVMREGGRLAVRAGLDVVDMSSLLSAIASTEGRVAPQGPGRRIGFQP